MMHALTMLNYPPLVSVYYSTIVALTELDIFNSASINELIFNFKETAPFNAIFEKNGIEDQIFINN